MNKIKEMYRKAVSFVKDERGQTMIEYALVAVLIAIVLVFIFKQGNVESGISAAASKVSSALSN